MVIRDVAQRRMLQLERSLLAQARLRILLAAADTTVAARRVAVRNVKARINSRRSKH